MDFNDQLRHTCLICDKIFKTGSGLYQHLRQVHKVERCETGGSRNIVCSLCSNEFISKKALEHHFENYHNIPIIKEVLKFCSEEDFLKWKREVQCETTSLFVKTSGSKFRNNEKFDYLYCLRSGHYKSETENRKRHLKSLGTNKINAMCPAVMKVHYFTDGTVCVDFTKTHIGHEAEIARLPLDDEERKSVAVKLANNVPVSAILGEVRDSKSDGLRRINLLKIRDILNIKKQFNVNVGDTLDSNSADMLDSNSADILDSNNADILDSNNADILDSNNADCVGKWVSSVSYLKDMYSEDDETISTLEFLMQVGKLKHLKRTGWVNHGIPDCETVSGHMYRMSIMAFLLNKHTDRELNQDKCIRMALIHDLAECIVGDITPFSGISKEEKFRQEMEAMKKLCDLAGEKIGKEMFELFQEYEAHESKEAKAVKDLDRFDMILQAYEYETDTNKPKSLQNFFDSTEGSIQNPEILKWVGQLRKMREQTDS